MWWFSGAEEDVKWWLGQTAKSGQAKVNCTASEAHRPEKAASGFADNLRRLSRELTSAAHSNQQLQESPRDVATPKHGKAKLVDASNKSADKAPTPPAHWNGLDECIPHPSVLPSEDCNDDSDAHPEAIFYAIVKFNFSATQEDELSLREGQLVAVLETSTDGWWLGEEADKAKNRGSIAGGWFPASYVHAIREQATPSQVERKANAAGNKQVSVALVAPYVSLVGPLESSSICGDFKHFPTMDRLNMNFNRNMAADGYDPVSNSSWPRAGIRVGSLFTGLEPVIETVLARFSFQARGAEELSFGKGERLDILERPEDDPDWLLAANCLGQKGLVPINHLQDIDTSAGSNDLPLLHRASANRRDLAAGRNGRADVAAENQHQPWFFGPISRAYADVLLNAFGSVGDFLIRSSESNAGDLSLTARGPGCNRHFQIHVDDVQSFHIGHRKFFHLSDLVDYYKRIPIYTTPEGYKLYLVKPFKKP